MITLVRAGQNDSESATQLISSLILADPDPGGDTPRWRAVLATATAQGGAAALSLERLAHRDPSPLPLDQLSQALPFSTFGLFELALLVDQRRLADARIAGADATTMAELLERVSARADNAGDRDAALASITEAVDIRRRLAAANPAAYLPDLAMSLNNLSNQQSNTGDRDAALTSITEAASTTASWPRPTPPPTCPTSPGR